MELPDVYEAVHQSVQRLYASDADLFGTTERVLASRLAIYLFQAIDEPRSDLVVVDCEYQRFGAVIKAFAGDGLRRKIIPDVLLHRRRDAGRDGNILAIEVKPRFSRMPSPSDRAKITMLVGVVDEVVAIKDGLRCLHDLRGQPDLGRVRLPDWVHPYSFGLCLALGDNQAALDWWRRGGPPDPTREVVAIDQDTREARLVGPRLPWLP
jgi:hypothetical protein